ncbi:riboflavin synthase, partial [bacterium]|nr:riboflavin synthase [bacterium]
MFTGIVSGLGEIQAISALGDGLAVTVSIKDIGTQLNPGDSIALNGVCTTALDIQQDQFTVQLLDETLKKTTFGDAKAGHLLNWEL